MVDSNLKFLRKKNGLTQAQLAEKLNIKRSLVGAYEEGRAEPRLSTLVNISRLFDISLDQLVTFDLSKNKYTTGEIYISIDRVKENSILNNTSYPDELRRVIFHGALHLCGYLDKNKEEKELMTEKENFYLEQFNAFHVETR